LTRSVDVAEILGSWTLVTRKQARQIGKQVLAIIDSDNGLILNLEAPKLYRPRSRMSSSVGFLTNWGRSHSSAEFR
jgi:hypothetical protein